MNKKTVFVVVENSAYDYDEEINLFVFDSLEKAQIKKDELIEKSGIRDEVDDNYYVDEDDGGYQAYPDGEYCENHYEVYILEKEIM